MRSSGPPDRFGHDPDHPINDRLRASRILEVPAAGELTDDELAEVVEALEGKSAGLQVHAAT